MKKKWSIIGGIVVIIIALAFFLSAQRSKAPDSNNTIKESTVKSESTKKPQATNNYNLKISTDGKTVSYEGKTGKSAYDILKEITDLDTKDTSFGPQIMTINGVKSTDKEYWLYTVNGKAGMEGAHEYQTKNSDKIEWKLTGM